MHPTASDTISDIVQNAFEAGSSEVMLQVMKKGSQLEVVVKDNGPGMDQETIRNALDPFYTAPGKHPGRKVGLGLPFLKQAAEQSGGTFDLQSRPGHGTTVHFSFDLSNVDAPPLGDAATAFTSLMAYPGNHELLLQRSDGTRTYEVRRSELRDALGDLETAGSLGLLKTFFASNEAEIHSHT